MSNLQEFEQSAYLKRSQEEFLQRADILLKKIERPLREGRLKFGPVYHLPSSAKQDFGLHSVTNDLAANHRSPQMRSKRITLFAMDARDRLAGFRTAELIDYSQYDYYDEEEPWEKGYEVKARGEVVTLARKAGVATSLELIYLFLLQQEANTKKAPVVHKVDPGNLRALHSLGELARSTGNQKDWEILKHKQEEVDRWLHLYGDNGIFGFTGYKRTFLPEEAALDIADESDVYLSRLEITGQTGRKIITAKVEQVTPVLDRGSYQDIRTLYFKEHVLPQLKSS